MTFMIASATMPRGVGETKLKVLFQVESNPRKWKGKILSAEGWSDEALASFLNGLDGYFKWRDEQFPTAVAAATVAVAVPAVAATRGAICFTGFRSAALESAAVAKGYSISSTVSKKVVMLLVPDSGEETGTKVEKARELGIRICRKSDFMRENNIVL
jgi:NAD-dependent DNA ligase